MNKEIDIKELIKLAKNNVDDAAKIELKSDNCELAKKIYSILFDFYIEEEFSGDLIFTWKSPSLVKDGYYIGKRNFKVDNTRVIGNIFPNYKSKKIYSLNLNRNAMMGDFPHDYFDIYLYNVAKYAYNIEMPNIKEYFPLKRAITNETNTKYFKKFTSFEHFLKENYLEDIWEIAKITPFSEMKFEEFKDVSTKLIKKRGIVMLNDLIKKQNKINKN